MQKGCAVFTSFGKFIIPTFALIVPLALASNALNGPVTYISYAVLVSWWTNYALFFDSKKTFLAHCVAALFSSLVLLKIIVFSMFEPKS